MDSNVNIYDKSLFEKVARKIFKNIRLKPSKTKTYPYASELLVTKSYVMCKLKTPH